MTIEAKQPIVELSELRIKLDQMTERVVSLLKDRTRSPLNEAIYQKDGVEIKNRSGISLFEFALEGLENYHASLGRYNYPGQFPIFDSLHPKSSVVRLINEPALREAKIDIKEDLFTFYKGFVKKLCKPGDNPNHYGSTAHIDAQLVELIHERVNLGRYVSEAKVFKDPELYGLTNNPELLLVKLKDRDREESLVNQARKIALSYQLDENITEELFRWMIDKTLFIEIAYLQQVSRDNCN